MIDKCENCKFYAELKQPDKGFKYSNACLLFARDKYVQEVEPESKCEMFTENKETEK